MLSLNDQIAEQNARDAAERRYQASVSQRRKQEMARLEHEEFRTEEHDESE